MASAAGTLDRAAIASMQQLAAQLREGAAAEGDLPDLERMKRLLEYLDRDLAALYEDSMGLHTTASRYRMDPAEAMARLQQARLRAEAGTASRALRGLREHLGRMERQFTNLEQRQRSLWSEAQEANEEFLQELMAEQEALEEEMMDPLSAMRKLLDRSYAGRRSAAPRFPAAPYRPYQDRYYVPPREQDTEDPDTMAKTPEDFDWWEARDRDGEDDEEEFENPYLPLLGGPMAALDPRYSDLARSIPGRRGKGQGEEDRNALNRRQWQRLQELDMAGRASGTDREALASMVDQLWDNMRGMWSWGAGHRQQAAESLRSTLASDPMQQALSMAEQLQQMMEEQRAEEGAEEGAPTGWAAFLGSFRAAMGGGGGAVPGQPFIGELPELDVSMRTVLLGMQPKLREELLNGMQERGPEAYREFIENYYRKLTAVKEEAEP